MYCDHPSCKKEVDINSVAVSQPKSAYTMFNEDGLGMTRVGGGNDSIVNVCKSCGSSEHLWDSIEAKNFAEWEEENKRKIETENKERKNRGKKIDSVDAKELRIIYIGLFTIIVILFFIAAFTQS